MEIGRSHHGKHQTEISRKKHHGHKKEEYSMEPKDNTSFGQSVQNDPTKQMSEMKKKIEDSISTVATGGISQGTAEKGGTTVEIGTYNMEWLGDNKEKPRSDKDYAMLAQVIKDSGVEVMGVQEIADEKGLQKVVSNLPGFDYILGTTGVRGNGKKQFIGIIYNAERVQCDKSTVKELKEAQVPQLMGDNHLRAPLIVDMKADNFSFTLVNLHMKSKRGDTPKVSIRDEQAKIINKWMKDQIAAGKDKDIIVVGDCNDFLDSQCMKSLSNGVLQMTTEEAKAKGEYSNIPWKSLIDQIGVTMVNINGGPVGGAVANYIKDSTHVFDTRKYPNHKKWGSDHMPVVASFKSDVDLDG